METLPLVPPATPLSPVATPAEHSLVRFWRAAYARYEHPIVHGVGFHVPSFPGPLLSPKFAVGTRARFLDANRGRLPHFNEILPLGHGLREPAPVGYRLTKSFYLGSRPLDPAAAPCAEIAREEVPLADALGREELWHALVDGFGDDAAFLRAFLPFLTTLDASFRTLFLRERGELVGVVTVGAAGKVALTLNAVVLSGQRGRGLSGTLVHEARALAGRLGAREACFWTEHPFLLRHAENVHHYRVFERA